MHRNLFYLVICLASLAKLKDTEAVSQNTVVSLKDIYKNSTSIDSLYMPVADRVKIEDTFNYYANLIANIKPSLIGANLTVNGGSVTLPTMSIGTSSVTRALNTSFQVSTTRNAIVVYTVSITVTSTLTGTNSGTVNLQISPNNSTWTTINLEFNSGAGVLSTTVQACPLFAVIPAGYYVRLNTISTGANTATFSYLSGQEILN